MDDDIRHYFVAHNYRRYHHLTVFLTREILESRRQTRFIDSVTHELKSPLASLRLCVQTLVRRQLKETQKKDMHQMMLDDIDRLSFFIDDILEASRLADGPRNQLLGNVDLMNMLQDCAQRILKRHRIPQTAITIEAQEHLELITDSTALEMILRNLLDNAVKYSGDEPNILVLAQKDAGNSITISVKDHGIGIPLYESKRIFERFYRSPIEAVHRRSGTGIGLYVAAQLVHTLGGKLSVHSEGLHKGSTFYFSLPLSQ